MAKKHNDKGYLLWKNLIADYKEIDPDTDITYDYEGYYNKYPGEAWSILRGNSEAHFPDEFKTIYHPTFSTLSSYSGKIHPLFNPEGLEGGTWKDDNTFVVSDDLYKSPVSMDERINYFIDNEPNGVTLRESDGSLPYMSDGTFYGGVLPEVTVTSKKYDTGGSLKAPLDWNELTMKEKAAFIRMGVSNGYKDIDSIRKIYNEFKKGGKKLGASEDILKKIFLGTLNESLRSERGRKEFSHYDTPEWRRYLTELALKESSYRANVFNDIGALGYFQLMPSNRSNKGGRWWNDRTLLFYDMYRMTDTNYKLLKKLMKPSDWTKAASLGIDIYGLLGGAHLGGVGGVIKALRGVKNAKDKNGSSVLGYMRKFSLSNRNVPESDIQDIYPVMHQDTNYLPLPMYELLYAPQAILSFNLEEPLITIPMETEESPATAVEEAPAIKEPVYREVSPLDMVRLFNNQIIQMLPALYQLPTTATEILKALELKRQLEQKNSLLNSNFLSYLNTDNLFPIGGPLITVNKGDRVSTDQCAQWSNGLLRDNGYLINGNAWNLNNVDMLFNGFDGLTRPEVYDSRAVTLYNHLAADNVYKNFDSKTLDVTKPYVVNMYYNNSPSLEDAYNNGDDVTGTHTGVLTYDDKKKQWYVTHNIHGNIHLEPFISLLNGKGKYGVTAIYSPREATIWNRLKGAFGFAEGGNLFDDGGDKDNIFRYTNSNGDVRYVYQDNSDAEEVPVRPLNTIFPDPAQWTFTDDAGRFYTPRRTTPTNTAELNPDNRTGFERALDNYIGEAFNTVPKGYHTLPAIGAAAFGLANPALGEAALTSGFGAHGLSKWMNGEVNGPLDAAMTAVEITPLGRAARPIWNAGKEIVYNTADRYIFMPHQNSFTRGIGGETGLRDLVESGLVRGNPVGTEVSAKAFGKMYRHNRSNFKDIMDATGREGIAQRYYNRTLSEEDFNAIKKAAEPYVKEYNTLPKEESWINPAENPDPLEAYLDYNDYKSVLSRDRQTLARVTSMDDSGQPLAYFYDDGRNPLTAGHDYASSDYGVRINNASEYNPRIFRGHLHYSMPKAVSLRDPNVEVFKTGPLGLTIKLDKQTLQPVWKRDLFNAFRRGETNTPQITVENATSITPEQLAILGSASDSPYTYKSSNGFDLFSKHLYSRKIHGYPSYTTDAMQFDPVAGEFIPVKREWADDVVIGLPKDAQDAIMHDVADRNIAEFMSEGLSLEEATKYAEAVKKQLNSVRSGAYSQRDYDKAGWGDFGGFYDPERNFISINEASNPKKVYIHEGRHLLDHKIDDEILLPRESTTFGTDFDSDVSSAIMQRTRQKQEMILRDAYDSDFESIPSSKYAEGLEDYNSMNREAITTNIDSRTYAYNNFADVNSINSGTKMEELPTEVLNAFIDNLTDELVFEAVEYANGYGRRYINRLRDEGKLTSKKAQQFRESMKHVGAYAAPLTLGAGALYGTSNQ